MLLGKYRISDHALSQYSYRVRNKGSVIKSINYDLRTLNIKNIIYLNEDIHVFTKGYKEFIFARNGQGLLLKTIIKRNREDTEKTIIKRKSLVTN